MNERGLGTLLRAITARLDGDVQTLYDEAGVDFRPRFFPLVQVMVEHGVRTIGQLADAAGVSQPAITQTVAEMAKLKLVETARGKDGRERQISLSTNGMRLAERLQPLWTATREATAELDRELPHSLPAVLRSTLQALDRKPFKDRIQGKLNA